MSILPYLCVELEVHTIWISLDEYRERLMKMITRMRERLEAKLANANNNAFKMRKLFKMYDKDHTGMV